MGEDIPLSVRGGCVSRFDSIIKDLNCLVLPMTAGKPHPPGVMEDGKPFMTRVFEAAQQLVESCDLGVVQCKPFTETVSVQLSTMMWCYMVVCVCDCAG